jgi:hypothetical protein
MKVSLEFKPLDKDDSCMLEHQKTYLFDVEANQFLYTNAFSGQIEYLEQNLANAVKRDTVVDAYDEDTDHAFVCKYFADDSVIRTYRNRYQEIKEHYSACVENIKSLDKDFIGPVDFMFALLHEVIANSYDNDYGLMDEMIYDGLVKTIVIYLEGPGVYLEVCRITDFSVDS